MGSTEPAVKIREAAIEDMPAVMALIGQSDMSPDNCLTPAQSQELFKAITATGYHRLYVAEVDKKIVGTFAMIVVQQLSHNGARSVIVEDVVVEKELQGLGIGQQMLRFACEQAQRLGSNKLCLSSGIAREQAHNFYERLGFVKDGYRFALSNSMTGNSMTGRPVTEPTKSN